MKEALDLCLACKGCKGECPVNVDMATYKAEFLSHYYEGKRRPSGLRVRAHRVVGAAGLAVRPASRTRDADAGAARVAKALAGIAPQRSIPPFAPQTFRDWLQAARRAAQRRRPAGDPVGRHVQQPTSTPTTARPRSRCSRRRGTTSTFPERAVLRPAALRLRHARPGQGAAARDPRRRCARRSKPASRSSGSSRLLSVFRDELLNLFPDDDDARRLSAQTMMLGEFLVTPRALDAAAPAPQGRAARALPPQVGARHGRRRASVLRKLGVDFDEPDAAAAAWRARSASRRASTTTSRSRSASGVLCPRCVRPRPDAIIIATASRAASRSRRPPTARACTSPT